MIEKLEIVKGKIIDFDVLAKKVNELVDVVNKLSETTRTVTPLATIEALLGKKNILKAGVPEDKLEECLAWAFGDDWRNIDSPIQVIGRWNFRHSKLFVFEDINKAQDFFFSVGKAFLESRQ